VCRFDEEVEPFDRMSEIADIIQELEYPTFIVFQVQFPDSPNGGLQLESFGGLQCFLACAQDLYCESVCKSFICKIVVFCTVGRGKETKDFCLSGSVRLGCHYSFKLRVIHMMGSGHYH
jgi:hypothetical protein